MKKLYCVHVFERYDYESIEAKTPEEAQEQVLKQNYPEYPHVNSGSVYDVIVMRYCECGYDNDTQNKKCDECGDVL